MPKLVWIETKRKREMRAFFCDECNALFYECPWWSIQKSLWMHLRGSGHTRITLLKIGEVEEGQLRFIGKAYGGFDFLLHEQGKPQPLNVTLYIEEKK